jgi:hypothetical protein
MQKSSLSSAVVHTDIPFRLDRLPWSRFHFLVVIGLGITWILDGLEVTIVGSLGPALQSAETLHLSSADLGAVASSYVVGAVTGALGYSNSISLRYFGRRAGELRGYEVKLRIQFDEIENGLFRPARELRLNSSSKLCHLTI